MTQLHFSSLRESTVSIPRSGFLVVTLRRPRFEARNLLPRFNPSVGILGGHTGHGHGVRNIMGRVSIPRSGFLVVTPRFQEIIRQALEEFQSLGRDSWWSHCRSVSGPTLHCQPARPRANSPPPHKTRVINLKTPVLLHAFAPLVPLLCPLRALALPPSFLAVGFQTFCFPSLYLDPSPTHLLYLVFSFPFSYASASRILWGCFTARTSVEPKKSAR